MEVKEYVKSTLITFAAGFALIVVPEINTLTVESFKDGTLAGLLFAGVRLGFKMALELFLSWYYAR